MLRKLFTRMALAALLLLTGAAAAQAAFYQFLTIESQGGYTRWNDKATFWAEVNGRRIVRGYALIERTYRGQGQDQVNMTGQLTPRETYDLWMAAYAARPWSAAEVHAKFVNVDFPDTKVTYMGRYTQTIRAAFVTPPAHLSVVSDEMEALTGKAWGHARAVLDQDLFVLTAQGGLSGYQREIRITQSGSISDDVNYLRQGAGTPHSKQGSLTPTELNELKQLVYAADWFNLTDFAGNPMIMDGIAIETTYTRWGVDVAIAAGYYQNRTPEYQAVIDRAEALADQLP